MSLVTVNVTVDAAGLKLVTTDDLKKSEARVLAGVKKLLEATVTDSATLTKLEKTLEESTNQLQAAVEKHSS